MEGPMPKAYSIDLRQRVVDAYEKLNLSYEAIAVQFSVGAASVDRWVSQFRRTGSVEPLPRGGGAPPKVDEAGLNILCELMERDRDATRGELARAYLEATGVSLSVATVGRRLWQLGYTRKKSRSTPPSETRTR
jgi:transposase